MAFEHYREFIPEFAKFIETLQRPLPVHLRINTLKIDPEELINMLKQKGYMVEKSVEGWNEFIYLKHFSLPGNLMEYALGYIHPQALTSCMVSYVLSPRPGNAVLDMCSAPGGKTSHIAQLMNNTGLLIANELNPRRHNALGYNLSRLGVLNSIITGYQAQQFPMRFRFDRVLADVPCSGEGTYRIAPGTRPHRKTPARKRLPELQKSIILRGFDLLKPEGIMIYSTCTYNPDENEGVVDHLIKNREAELIPINIPLKHEQGIVSWRGVKYDEQLRLCARFYPHNVNSVGFFMARIVKRK